MKSFRPIALGFLFFGLVALEVALGVLRLDTIRERHRQDVTATVERGHEDLVRELHGRLAEEREHAAYLARMPAVRKLFALEGPPPSERRKALEADLLPYILSFRGIDRVAILDTEGREQFCSERIGAGVGAIPEVLLDPKPDPRPVELTRATAAGDVLLAGIVFDARRVEVPESERQVLRFATAIDDGHRRSGVLVLTVYASPLLNHIRRFAPVEGVGAFLMAADGSYLASPEREKERGGPRAATLVDDFGEAAAGILSGQERAQVAGGLLLSRSVGEGVSGWRIVANMPSTALDRAAAAWRGEYVWVLLSMLFTMLVLVAAGAILVRASLREFRRREEERYRRQEKELERQMQLSERLGSLGLLTAGVAHEINNPLEGIENYLALLDREPLTTEKRKKYVEMVRYGFHRIRDIVRDLSSFARPQVSEGTADLAAVTAQAIKMVGYSREFKGIQVQILGLDGPLVVIGDAGRLEQVFINLLLNAAKALGGSGHIVIHAQPALDEESTGEAPGVVVTVEDDGPGIPEEILGRVFDPFFTTRDGTGLGLSISFGILRAHGGTITAANRKEGGACFTMTFPPPRPAAIQKRPERSGT